MLKKSIPHVFTSLNLICGCVATYFAFSHQFNAALFFVLFGVFFDFFDGFFARLLKVESALGIQLDSMADLITSGIAPGVLMYQLFLLSGVKQLDYTISLIPNFSMTFALAPVALFGFGITLGAAFRLARFNLIGENLPYFKGLPAPANAIMIMGLSPYLSSSQFNSVQPNIIEPFKLTVLLLGFDFSYECTLENVFTQIFRRNECVIFSCSFVDRLNNLTGSIWNYGDFWGYCFVCIVERNQIYF